MLFTERINGLCKENRYLYCTISTVCWIKPASTKHYKRKKNKNKNKLTGKGAGEITEEYCFMYTWHQK